MPGSQRNFATKDSFLRVTEEAGMARSAAEKLWRELEARYSEPHRCYHNLDHLDQMLGVFSRLETGDRRGIELAIWFHDVIYDPLSGENEAASAEYFVQKFRDSCPWERIETVRQLILATDHEKSVRESREADLLRDIDLSILAAEEGSYEVYRRAIRKEYAAVPEAAFRKGRIALLEQLLSGTLFRSPEFADFEARGRANLRRELALWKES
ncbi:MAG: hypothetical protein P1U85_07595 [Verrucomicrobiales bacterium]|nr:hypothetical protein [Verrucomicrobiales bacterium]